MRRGNPRTCAWCLTPFAKTKPTAGLTSAASLAALSAMRRYQAGDYHAFEASLRIPRGQMQTGRTESPQAS
jgi:hypothetical protein